MKMMRLTLLLFFALAALAGRAQSTPPMTVPAQAITQLEDLKERTKEIAAGHQKRIGKRGAETHPELNRYLVIAADDFVRVTKDTPSEEAYLAAIDKGLARLGPLATTVGARQQIVDYYQDLMEIVGMTTSQGKLLEFVAEVPAK